MNNDQSDKRANEDLLLMFQQHFSSAKNAEDALAYLKDRYGTLKFINKEGK